MNNFYGEKSFIRLQKEHGFIFVKQYGSQRYLCGYLKKIFDSIYAYVMVHGSKYHNNISFVKLYIITMQRLDDAVENDKSAFKELIGDFENFDSSEKNTPERISQTFLF